MSKNPSSAPPEVLVESGWNRLVTELVESPRANRIDGLVHFETPTGAVGTVTILDGSPQQFSWLERGDSAESVRTTVFFRPSGEAESITRTERSLRDFDSAIYRGPNRRTLTSELVLRQTFDSDGTPRHLIEYAPDAVAELHVHTRTFLAGNPHETANSFL